MLPDLYLLEALASALVAGDPTVDEIVARSARMLGRDWRWLRPLAQRYVETFAGRVRPRRRDVVEFLHGDKRFRRISQRIASHIAIAHWVTEPQRMLPMAAAKGWRVPSIESVSALADWLGTDVNYVEWFADLKALSYKSDQSKLRHYHYRVLRKDSGDVRLIEAPKQSLKRLQQRVLTGILNCIPAHPATHGFVTGRSIKTFAAAHAGKRVVLRIDLRNFFPSFRAARVAAFFRTMGYPETVAAMLAGICTNATPRNIWHNVKPGGDPVQFWETRRLYARPHLPQGAPTSPAIANLCCYRLDCRLAGLGRSAGAVYTRYADDLAFSGSESLEKGVERFSIHVAAIALEEGFSVNHHKTRIMRQSVRQRLAGVVVNQHPNVLRHTFDRLKAILTNCVRYGPSSQNREGHIDFRAHLEGRISFVEMLNRNKGARLRKLFEHIPWE